MANQTDSNANFADNCNVEREEISDSFRCCICLDLLYKPVVLSCGHISCFWCIHRSMSSFGKSRCPICRRMYIHFPSICVMLHQLLLKMYPIAYKMRENQILEEEKSCGFFSPQFDNHASAPLVGTETELHNPSDSVHSYRMVCESTSKGGSHDKIDHLESASLALNNGTTEKSCIINVAVTEKNFPSNKLNGNCKISISDALCTACKQLLIHPMVLNCGHVYCETCIIVPTEQQLKCEVCQCLNHSGFPKVCLELDQFLEEQFCKEYALRRDAVQLKKVLLKHDSGTTCSNGYGNSVFKSSTGPTEEQSLCSPDRRSKVHVGVGCDSCGILPIIGDRYKCKDCKEVIGFDLCGDCYRTRSKLPGRFNQRHTPEHRLELVKSNIFHNTMIRLVTGGGEDVFTAFVLTDDDNEETGSPLTLPNDSQEESTSSELTTSMTNSDNSIHQNDTESTG